MSKYTRRGWAEIKRKTLWLKEPGFIDGHRVAYADRREQTTSIRTLCRNIVVVAVDDLLKPEMAPRVALNLTCTVCADEVERLYKLYTTNRAAYASEMSRLENE